MKNILVTGADGFIGSHLTEALVREGYNVRAFVYYNSFGHWGWLDQCNDKIKNEINIFSGDIRDPFGVKTAMQDCDTVFHLAALIGIPYSYHSPAAYVETNINGTLNVLQAGRELQTEKIIHTSTSEVYGTARFVPITEEHPLQGQSPYAATKIGADQMALSFYRSFKTPVSIVRPFNTFGPRQSARAVIPTIITQIANGSTELKMGSTSPTRDFNYVSDIVKGFIAAARSAKSIGEVINIGSNYEISIADTIKVIADIMQSEVSIITDAQRIRPKDSEVERLWADNAKALKLLGWSPEYSNDAGLKKALNETVEWFTDEENLKNYKHGLYNI